MLKKYVIQSATQATWKNISEFNHLFYTKVMLPSEVSLLHMNLSGGATDW